MRVVQQVEVVMSIEVPNARGDGEDESGNYTYLF